MLPEAKSEDLLYVSVSVDTVNVYSYPEGKREGTLTGFATLGGLCADQTGNVFLADSGDSRVAEYAHGGTSPIRRLNDPAEMPYGCSVDPVTGNLAVTNYCRENDSGCDGAGGVSIYRSAQGKPMTYTNQGYNLFYCSYDNASNLFVDGYGMARKAKSEFAELTSDGKAFKNIALDKTIRGYGGVQWDGKELAVGNGFNVVYRMHVSGSRGISEGSTSLIGGKDVGQFWIQGSSLVGPSGHVYDHSSVRFWDYPAGGKATKTIGGLSEAIGVAVSFASK
jgi:hypothetical protein